MVSTNKLENDRINKLKKFTPKEATEYVESLVLELFKGYKGGKYYDNPDADESIEKLDEFAQISLSQVPESNNINAVINDRKMRYLGIAYMSAYYNLLDLKADIMDNIKFNLAITELEILCGGLKDFLMVYYINYSNYGFMENLLMDLSDDGLAVDSEIREKYVDSEKYGYNKKLMSNLDMEIAVIVKIILEKFDEYDKLYLVDANAEINKDIDDLIDNVHNTIKDFYEKSNNDFEICAYKQCGLVDSQLESIKRVKESVVKHNDKYLAVKNKLLELIDGNGFAELSAKKFEREKIYYPDMDFDDWIKTEPKYDVRNAKFIYPDN